MKRKAQGSEDLDSEGNVLTEDELQDKIIWMKFKRPSDSNKESIKLCLEETFPSRKAWILENAPSISEVFEQYPRLLDYTGEMIDQEFSLRFSGCADKFLGTFARKYTSKILSYAAMYREDILKKALLSLVGDENLKALVILCALLPAPNSVRGKGKRQGKGQSKGKGRKKSRNETLDNDELDDLQLIISQVPNPELMTILPENTNLPLEEREWRSINNKPNTPILNVG